MCIKHDAKSGERCTAKRVLLKGGKEIGLFEKQNSLSHSWYHEHVRLKADFFSNKKTLPQRANSSETDKRNQHKRNHHPFVSASEMTCIVSVGR